MCRRPQILAKKYLFTLKAHVAKVRANCNSAGEYPVFLTVFDTPRS